MEAAGEVFDGGLVGDGDPHEAVLVGEPGNGADIGMDTFEPIHPCDESETAITN